MNPNLAGSVQAYTTIGASQASAVSQYAAMTFLSALTASDAQTLAVAGSLLNAAPAAAAETVDVSIASFSLTDGIEISVGTQVAGAASPILSVADAAKVSVVLVASETPDFAQAKSVEIKDIVIKANAVTKELVDADEIRKAIADNDLGAAAFFKVKLLQK